MVVDGEDEEDLAEVVVREVVGDDFDEEDLAEVERADVGNIYILSVNTFVIVMLCERFWKKPHSMIGCI